MKLHHVTAYTLFKMADRRYGDIEEKKTAFFMCDMQERFRPVMKHFDAILEVVVKLVQASKLLDIPLIVTEQYPKGLGKTVSEIDITNAVKVCEKTKYSMVIPEVEDAVKGLCDGQLRHIVLFGVETHVCVQQTVIDLLKKGYEVHVIADGCTSRTQMDRKFALERFRHMGATVTTSDAILQQLIGGKDHPKFKDIQQLIKNVAPDSGL